MAWNDKGDQGPWGSKKPGSSQGNNSPDLDELLRQGQDNIRRMMGGGSGGRGNRPSLNPRFLALIAFIGIGLWAATGLYRVKEGEQAVVLRFGKVNRTAEAGLRYHIPAPVESARVVPISTINVVNSGTAAIVQSKQAFALRGSNVEDLMLTGDENLVKLRFTVHWFVKDISYFLFNDPNPEITVKLAAESAVREVLAQTTLGDALTTGKAKIIIESKKLLQKLLDEYQIGIEIAKVNLQEANPPDAVIDSFRDVQRARADFESKINEAKAYRNSIIPVARGNAQKLIRAAEAEKQGMIELAKGEAGQFLSVLEAYQKAPEITLTRLRIENSEDVLANVPKYVISGSKSSQGVLPYLPLKEMAKTAKVSGGK